MKPLPLLLALTATSTAISTQLIKNYCLESVFLTLTLNTTKNPIGPFSLPSGQAYSSEIVGEGNSAVVSKSADVWTDIPKLNLGTSSSGGTLYWSVGNESGDPMAGEAFNVTSSNGNVCGETDSYDGEVHACADRDVTLTLNLCFHRAS